MSEGNPVTGRPYEGRDEKPADGSLPGERPVSEDEQQQGAPVSADRNDETGSRAATGGVMSTPEQGQTGPSEGVPEQVHAPGPEDATESNAPGGSAANQSGRTPDQGNPTSTA